MALKYLKKSLEIDINSSNDLSSTAGTNLNICAILSHLGKHKKALKHCKVAISLLKMGIDNLNKQ